MEVIKILNLSDDDVEQLTQTGKLLRQVHTVLEAHEADTLTEDAFSLIAAIKDIAELVCDSGHFGGVAEGK